MNVHEIVRRYLAGESIVQLVKASGRSSHSIRRVLRERGVRLRQQVEAVRLAVAGRPSNDDLGARHMPTEEEIWGPLTAEVRASWSPDDYAARGREGVGRAIGPRTYIHNGQVCYASQAMS
jgi:hypothetical protein